MPNVGVYKARVKEIDQRTVVGVLGLFGGAAELGGNPLFPDALLFLKKVRPWNPATVRVRCAEWG